MDLAKAWEKELAHITEWRYLSYDQEAAITALVNGTELTELRSKLAEAEKRAEVAEAMEYALAHPVPSPCGHSSEYAHTDDGGKTIHCYVCQLTDATERAEKAEREREDAEAQLESQQRIIQAHHEYQAEALRVLFGAEFEEKSHEDYMQALKALKARAEAAEARAEKAEKALVVLRDAAGTAIGKLQDIASAATDAYCNEHDDVCCATCIQDTANEAIAALKEAL